MEMNKQECPFEDCSSSDAFCYNNESGIGKCHSCGGNYPPKRAVKLDEGSRERYPYPSDLEKGIEPMAATDNVVSLVSNVREPIQGERSSDEYRNIKADVRKKYNAVTVKDPVSKDMVAVEYTYPSGAMKVRTFPKDFYSVGSVAGELWGQQLFPKGCSKKITITEGEEDAMAAYQMINTDGRFENPVVSLPSSTPSKKFWDLAKNYLSGFNEIILSIDNDEAGNKIADRLNSVFSGKVKRVDHGDFKDACDFLNAGDAKRFNQLWWNAGKFTPDNIYNSPTDFLKLFREKDDFSYVPTGIHALDEKILGIMSGHFTLFKAPTGIGKTELMRYLEWNFLQRDVPFAAWHLEETKVRTLLGLVSYDLQDNLTRKDLVFEKDRVNDVEASIERISSKGTFFQYYMKEEDGIEELVDQIKLLAKGYGCKFIMFEPIQDVLSIASDEGRESALATLAIRLSKLAAELGVGIISIGHTNDDGDFKYCKMLGQRASVVISLQRDKHNDDEVIRNTTKLFVEKNRPNTLEGPAGSMMFDFKTFTMEEM